MKKISLEINRAFLSPEWPPLQVTSRVAIGICSAVDWKVNLAVTQVLYPSVVLQLTNNVRGR